MKANPDLATPDITVECAGMLERLMLAQVRSFLRREHPNRGVFPFKSGSEILVDATDHKKGQNADTAEVSRLCQGCRSGGTVSPYPCAHMMTVVMNWGH